MSKKVERSNTFTETVFELEAVPDPQTELADKNSPVSEHQNETSSPPYTVFYQWERYFLVGFASYLAVFSSISVPIYLPALPDIETEFNITTEKINLTVVTYTIFQGLGPAFWCPISDRFGRRIVYMCCTIVYIAACVGLALAPSYGALLGLRALQAAGMAATVAIGSGVIGDITTRQERGGFVGIFSGFTLVGSAVGPIIGGALTSSFGTWRSIFWFLVIACGVSFVLLIVAYPETARFIVGNGSIKPRWFFAQSPIMILRGMFNSAMKQKTYSTREEAKEKGLLADTVKVSMISTFRIVCYKDVAMVLIPIGLHYTAWFMVITAQSTLLKEEYNFSVMNVGVSYLANGAGSLIGSLVSGRILDAIYKIHANRYKAEWEENYPGTPVNMEEFDIQQARLSPAKYISTLVIATIITFGWTIQYHVHYMVPIIMTGLISFGSVFFISIGQCLLIDLFPGEGSTASAGLNVVRCLLCAIGLAVVDRMIKSLGCGGTFTLMAGILVLSWSCIFIEQKKGQKWDKERRDKKKASKQV